MGGHRESDLAFLVADDFGWILYFLEAAVCQVVSCTLMWNAQDYWGGVASTLHWIQKAFARTTWRIRPDLFGQVANCKKPSWFFGSGGAFSRSNISWASSIFVRGIWKGICLQLMGFAKVKAALCNLLPSRVSEVFKHKLYKSLYISSASRAMFSKCQTSSDPESHELCQGTMGVKPSSFSRSPCWRNSSWGRNSNWMKWHHARGSAVKKTFSSMLGCKERLLNYNPWKGLNMNV